MSRAPTSNPHLEAMLDQSRTEGITGNPATADDIDKRLDQIEMIGEEEAAELNTAGSVISPGLRYLHCSRTIHQLVTDRNRAVGIYLAVASLLWTASTALLNAKPGGQLIIPIEAIQRWCLPVTFAILTLLAIFVALLLIRTRVGLIYEAAKMNALLGLPVGRVQRVNPFSIFFIMHALICVAGGGSAAFFVLHLVYDPVAGLTLGAAVIMTLTGLVVTAALVLLYVGMVRYTTADDKLQKASR